MNKKWKDKVLREQQWIRWQQHWRTHMRIEDLLSPEIASMSALKNPDSYLVANRHPTALPGIAKPKTLPPGLVSSCTCAWC